MPAQAGIQGAAGNSVMDSRLRGNDGEGARMTFISYSQHIFAKMAVDLDSKCAFSGMTL